MNQDIIIYVLICIVLTIHMLWLSNLSDRLKKLENKIKYISTKNKDATHK